MNVIVNVAQSLKKLKISSFLAPKMLKLIKIAKEFGDTHILEIRHNNDKRGRIFPTQEIPLLLENGFP